MRKKAPWLIAVSMCALITSYLWYELKSADSKIRNEPGILDQSLSAVGKDRDSGISPETTLADSFDSILNVQAGDFSSAKWAGLIEQMREHIAAADSLTREMLKDEEFERRLLAFYSRLELFGLENDLSEYALAQNSVAFGLTAMDWLYRNQQFSTVSEFTDKFVEQLDDQGRLEMLSYLGRPMGERDLPASFSMIGLGVVENAELSRLLRADQSLQVSLRDKLLLEEISPALRNAGLDLLKEADSAEFQPAINNLIEKSVDGSRSQSFLEHLRDRPIGYDQPRLEFHQESVMAGNLEEKQALQSAEIILDAIRIDPSIPIDESVLARIRDYLENQSISTRGTELRLADIAYYQWISKDQ